jgi:uncharacterized protein YbjT (DUF2867 family)
MNIVITGSLGHISKPLAKELIQKQHAVTIISSNSQKQTDIESLGAKAAIGSVEDAHFLAKTFTGADAVYCMTPPNFSHPDQVAYYEQIAQIYAEGIRESGIRRVIYLSSYGAHLSSGTGFITGSHKAENILNAIPGIIVTHIRPTFFYYNLLGFIPMIKTAGFIGAVYGGEDKLAMVSPRDIAAAIAEEITQQRSGTNIRYVTSDDRTCNEIAQVLGSAIGKPDLPWKILPPEQVLQSLQSNGIPKNAAENLVELGMAIHSGVLREDFEKHKPPYGTVSLEEFSKEFAAVYNQPIESNK